jgi:hypothetical protein
MPPLALGLMMRLAPLATLALVIVSAPAFAYTSTEAKNCMKDAFKLCSAAIPNVDRVAKCMHEKRSQLTPACAEAVDRFFAKAAIGGSNKPIVYRN